MLRSRGLPLQRATCGRNTCSVTRAKSELQFRHRAALKLGWASDQADDVPETAAHFGQEGWTGAIAGTWLATNPGPCFSLDGAPEKPQNGGRDGMADATTVFARADIQWVMGAIFDRPVLAHQFQEAGDVGLRGRQAGDDPDGFDLLTAVFEFTNAVNPSHLRDVWKAHLVRGHFSRLDATPFDTAVALIHRLMLRGKKLPAGSGTLAFGGRPGCL